MTQLDTEYGNLCEAWRRIRFNGLKPIAEEWAVRALTGIKPRALLRR